MPHGKRRKSKLTNTQTTTESSFSNSHRISFFQFDFLIWLQQIKHGILAFISHPFWKCTATLQASRGLRPRPLGYARRQIIVSCSQISHVWPTRFCLLCLPLNNFRIMSQPRGPNCLGGTFQSMRGFGRPAAAVFGRLYCARRRHLVYQPPAMLDEPEQGISQVHHGT